MTSPDPNDVAVEISVRVAGPLATVLSAEEVRTRTCTLVASEIDTLAQDLGLAIRSSVTLECDADPVPRPLLECVLVRVAGRRCRYPDTAPAMILDGLRQVAPGPEPRALLYPDMNGNSDQGHDPDRWAPSFIAGLVAEAVKTRCSVLLVPPLVARFAAAVEAAGAQADRRVTDPAWLGPVLGPVLDLWTPLTPIPVVVDVLASVDADDDSAAVIEALHTRLSRDEIEVLVPPAVAPRLGAADSDDTEALLRLLAIKLFEELGVVIPRTRVVDGGEPDRFAFRLNGVRTHWYTAVPEGWLLVDGRSVDLEALDIPASPVVDPRTSTAGWTTPVAWKQLFEPAGVLTWDRASHVVLCLAIAIQRCPGFCVTHDRLQAQLEVLADAFPELIRASRYRVSGMALTAALRELVTDRISVRDLRSVLERVVDVAYLSLGRDRFALVDDPVPADAVLLDRHDLAGSHDGPQVREADLAGALRVGMRRQTTLRLPGSAADTPRAYLVDPALTPAGPDGLTEQAADDLLEAVRRVCADRPWEPVTGLLFVADAALPTVSCVLRQAMPGLRVHGLGDVSGEVLDGPLEPVRPG
jgi:hypothetical protein